MPEPWAWPEGSVFLWTGTATASAVVAYATDIRAYFQYGVMNYRTLDSAYHDRWTGLRVDLYIGALWTPHYSAIRAMADAQTGAHLHLKHVNPAGGSAGHFLYSGAIDGLDFQGREGDLFRMGAQFHANVWSAYG